MSDKLAALAALTAVLALSACQGDGPIAADGPTVRPTPSSSAASTPTGSTDPTSIEVTAPGSELGIGDPAVLPLFDGVGGTALARVTVTSIDPGTTTELEEAGVRTADAHALFYIYLDLEILSTTDEPFDFYSPLSNFFGLVGPFRANSLLAVGDASPCDIDAEFGDDAQAGDTLKGCIPVFANRDTVVDGVQFTLKGDAGYDLFEGEPVVWR